MEWKLTIVGVHELFGQVPRNGESLIKKMTDVMWMKDVKSCDHLQLTKMLSFRTLILLEAFTVPIRFYSVLKLYFELNSQFEESYCTQNLTVCVRVCFCDHHLLLYNWEQSIQTQPNLWPLKVFIYIRFFYVVVLHSSHLTMG